MQIELYAVGGYMEVGKNMTLVKCGDESVILDMGLHLPNLIEMQDDMEHPHFSVKEMIAEGAIPDDSLIEDIRGTVKAIVTTHGHLDHCGAIPYLARRYDCPIIATPYSLAIIKRSLEEKELPNEMIPMMGGSRMQVGSFEVEFVHITHSIPQTVTIVLHTPAGVLTYSNDFKLDDKPVLGLPPDYARYEKLGDEGVKVSIMDCLYAGNDAHTPSEESVQEKLNQLMLTQTHKGLIVTTFSSQITRLESIVKAAKNAGREPVLLGRSMSKYIGAAMEVGLWHEDVDLYAYPRQVRRKLHEIMEKGKEHCCIICTGHQGEEYAILSRLAREDLPYEWGDDCVIFSSQIIPSEVNKEQSAKLEHVLKERGAEILRNVHASGHASRKDLKHFFELLRPEIVVPVQGLPEMVDAMGTLCEEIGIKDVRKIKTGDIIKL